ncbi:L-ascorbate metabolism protein UlaG (beta-lactamase superfamily) [Spinactinospora alkalitolerans]|uniref:L-ascorbate metabolism protein UlaG (Beta-lactamase superfamily) n=1 Tax=Spinactinospora alkalitolerans TaxID=687207 RepID=A0A852TWK6_9ACTN|nr:MBL fold metallo-hydrolase [Spinactinospora alkalitolerans]NYE47697.1 L-ascorbate metabolism protein UlaG (beta-lactamase superfamily) [Spinactinospora alkalitolerans]
MSDLRFNRRGFFRTATAGAALTTMGVASPPAAGAAAAAPARGGGGATADLTWLGTSGWRIEINGRTVLFDPYVSRFKTGLYDGAFDAATPLTVDTAAVDAHVGEPELILVSHSHWDHFADVPYIAARHGARIVGTATTCNLASAFDLTEHGLDPVPNSRLSGVKGGEVFDFGDFTVEVVASLHSRNKNYAVLFSGVRLTPPSAPATIADLPEGDTLAYQVTVKGGPSIFLMGASDFVERNLSGLEPDVAMIALPAASSTYDYVPRLVKALDGPATVVPVHWDVFEGELANPPTPDTAMSMSLEEFTAEVREASRRTKVTTPEYLTPCTFG